VAKRLIAVALGGAIALYEIVKVAVDRARPPMGFWIGQYFGKAFPSGHATQSLAFFGMAALIFGAGLPPKTKTWLWAGAAIVILLVGASRLYLGGHWLSDVLGGWALGATWLALVVAVTLMLPATGQGERTPLGIVDGRRRGASRPPGRAAA
jgi:undecaprenyl-diphosphatase